MAVTFNVGKGVLTPANEDAREVLAESAIGSKLDVEVIDPNDERVRRMLFAAIGIMARDRKVSREDMRVQLLMGTGRADLVTTIGGRQVWMIRSMKRGVLQGVGLDAMWTDTVRWVEEQAADGKISNTAKLELSNLFERHNAADIPEDCKW